MFREPGPHASVGWRTEFSGSLVAGARAGCNILLGTDEKYHRANLQAVTSLTINVNGRVNVNGGLTLMGR